MEKLGEPLHGRPAYKANLDTAKGGHCFLGSRAPRLTLETQRISMNLGVMDARLVPLSTIHVERQYGCEVRPSNTEDEGRGYLRHRYQQCVSIPGPYMEG